MIMNGLSLMPERSYFAERLRELRGKAGLSQPALADRAGIGISTLRQFEYGRREPTFATLLKLAAGLGVGLSAFDPPDEPEPPKPRRRKQR
jgi:transcriptional regulator with XRE-family HTH domain